MAEDGGNQLGAEAHLGPYRLRELLGAGGMGKVYRADGPDGVVALKVVHPHLLENGDAAERFRREVEIGKTVDHPNVVRTFDGGEILRPGHSARHYLAMEYVEGQTLDALRAEFDRVPEELCRHIGREVCRGLGAIHAAGAVHRDIKPENIIISLSEAKPDDHAAGRASARRPPDGSLRDAPPPERTLQPQYDHVVKIMDFGVACVTDDALRLSQTGAFVGSLHYAAPEQFLRGGKDLDGRADLHALGLVLYELSCAEAPYYAEELPQVLRKVLHEEPRRLGEINPQLSAFFEEVVHCLLAKEREERFSDADELLAVLEAGEDSPWWHHRARAMQLATHRPIRRVRIPRETAVHGRDAELATLRALYERAKSGDGNVVLIEGEAGIGKSRLVDELIGQLQRDGEEIDFLFGSYPPGGAATAAGAFSTAFREQFGAAGSAPYLPENQVLVPAFDALLRGDTTPKDAEPLTKDSLQTCFVRATQTLATERVVVVLVDDLHFAPEEGRALFTSLAMGVPGHRVLLVGTARPGMSEDWQAGLTRLAQTSRVAMPRIGPKDLMSLLRDALKSDRLADALAGQIATKSDGNPFFAFEIIRGLREGQLIRQQEDGTWVSTRVIEDIQIPSSVMDLIHARIADLTEEEQELLDVAACCGFEFDPGLVAEAVGMRRIPALRAFGGIERTHRLVRSAGRSYVFDHHQVQEVLHAGLHEQIREEYHAALAEALETREGAAEKDPETLPGALCVTLCEHYLAGARGEAALRYLASAQSHLTDGYLHAHVVLLSERALGVPGLLEGARRARVLLRLADVNGPLNSMGRRDRQAAYAREAERLSEEAGDEERRGKAARALGWCLYLVSRHDEAEAALRRAQGIARSRGDKTEEAAATGDLGSVFFSRGRLAEAKEHYDRHLALAEEIGNRQGEAVATGNLGLVWQAQGRLAEAKEHYEGDLALSREIGNRAGEARATGNLGTIFQAWGRLAEAKEHHEGCIALSREIGCRQVEAIALHNLGVVLREGGESALADERLAEGLALSEEIGDQLGVALTYLMSGSLRATAGDAEGGRERLDLARDLAREIGLPGVETLARCELALLRVGDDGEDGGGDAEDALAAFAEHGERLDGGERRAARLLLYRATGDRAHLEAAKRLLDDALEKVPGEHHESMCRNLRVNREILAAWEAEGA